MSWATLGLVLALAAGGLSGPAGNEGAGLLPLAALQDTADATRRKQDKADKDKAEKGKDGRGKHGKDTADKNKPDPDKPDPARPQRTGEPKLKRRANPDDKAQAGRDDRRPKRPADTTSVTF